MAELIIIRFDDHPGLSQEDVQDIKEFIGELSWRLPKETVVSKPLGPDLRYIESDMPFGGGEDSTEILIALLTVAGSILATSITALTFLIGKYIEGNMNREITVEIGGRRMTAKGPNSPSKEEIAEFLFPEFAESLDEPSPRLIDRLNEQSNENKVWLKSEPPEELGETGN